MFDTPGAQFGTKAAQNSKILDFPGAALILTKPLDPDANVRACLHARVTFEQLGS